ncbi:hypothetical protein N7460_000948 [Penicillium canescens]|uniref:Uncharacterized protein n=2 Tax=Penicillium canescens TaxID=5083 RepID=A0AAD6IRG6_PENCN|nr:hypothetical protein N7460_000948 [Penicillium canescens]
MCHHTYHHYPNCGHISSWTVRSCQEFTNRIRLTDPAHSCSCKEIQITHDMAESTQPNMCVQCEREWANMISHGNYQAQTCKALVDGLDVEGPLVEIKARMVCDLAFNFEEVTLDDIGSIISTDDDEQGGVLLDPFYDLLGDSSSQVHKTDTFASHESTDSSSALLHQKRTETDASSLDLPPALVDSFISSLSTSEYFSSSYDSSDYESSSEGSDVLEMTLSEAIQANFEEHLTWRSALTDAGIIKPRTSSDAVPEESCVPDLTDSADDLLEFEHTELPNTSESDDESDFTFVDATSEIASNEDEYAGAVSELEDRSPYEWIVNLERNAARVEATVAKRIEEDYERYRRQAIISSLLDKALFWKDQADKREQNAELGIEEDPYLWDTESQLAEQIASSSFPVLGPKTDHHDKEKISSKAKVPLMHIYDSPFSADSDQEAEKQGLFAFAPIVNTSGMYEGFMEGLSAADVQDMGLQFPQHVRGCCNAVPAPCHLYYGAVYAASKEAVRRKGLEDIQPAPERRGKYYGIIKANSKEEAAKLDLINPQHPRGCCIDAFHSVPPRVPHVYYGTMSAASTEEAVSTGMYGSRPIPDKDGESYGFVETYSLEEAEGMGPKNIQHAQECCSLAQLPLLERIQHLYYGYMFGPSEEAVMQKGLKDPLLLPGFSDKFSGVVFAFSADEARQTGMFEPLRVMWDSDVALTPDFEE